MNAAPDIAALDRAALDPEWARIALMIALAESTRVGATPREDFSTQFDAANAAVHAGRNSGVWWGLRRVVAEDWLQQFVQLDLDILAFALAAEARPSLAPRLQSLQPQVGGPFPSLALLQELLMLDRGEEIAGLFDRLEPAAPLVASGLIRVAGDGAYQTVSASPSVARALLHRATHLAPPPGAHLVLQRGSWKDLILPDAATRSLKDLVAWIRNRARVTAWGGRPLGGPLALFAGPSGTGKTFASGIIAEELSRATGEPWALYCLDLGRIMSKYVGETERNLNALLDALDGRRAILQIDEADGLLGKRGEISDARDRYANLEVSHLLSRIERHTGPVVLTTNLRSNINSAFLRRFQLVVEFPAPDAAARARLWSALLPPGAPRADGVDPEALAVAVQLSGGAIHNAAQYGAVLAAEEDAPIAPRHLARAIWAELSKDNRQVRRSEIGFLSEHLENAP